MTIDTTYEYPVELTPDKVDGGFTVQFPDLPEAITQGESIEHALDEARDALEEAIANRIMTKQVVPHPSTGEYRVPLPAGTALKAAFYTAIADGRFSQVELAAELGVDEREIRRLLDPYHPTKLNRLEELLGKLGKRLVIQVQSIGAGQQLKAPAESEVTSWNPARRNVYQMPKLAEPATQVDPLEIAV